MFEQWANEAAWIGFNGSNVTDLGSWENLVELLARGLHKRVDLADLQGSKRDFGGICLEKAKELLGKIHYGAAFKYGKDVRCEEKSGLALWRKRGRPLEIRCWRLRMQLWRRLQL